MINFELEQISSLEKVYLDADNGFIKIDSGTALKGERFSYQLKFKSDSRFFACIEVDSPLKQYISVRLVGNVPSELPAYADSDENYERTAPGLFPDVLYPIENNIVVVKPNNSYSLWVTVEIPESFDAGKYPITIRLYEQNSDLNDSKIDVDTSKKLELEVLDAVLPEQKLIYTQWFHSDCIAQYYNVEVFSEKYWELVEKFMLMAVRTGVNMILTPIFTPPLDTEIGRERLTVQLVDIKFDGIKYTFGFDKLKRWINTAKRCGIKYFEISHLFSQWGAKYAPKVEACVNGEMKKIFYWNTLAVSEEYKSFLQQFLPCLIEVIKSENIEKYTYFHISDEPNSEQTETYLAAKSIVHEYLKDFEIMDALSEYEFYEKRIITHPVPNTNEIQNFIARGVRKRWTYYCCGQYRKVSNRFFGMPLSRTRIIGVQLYKYDIEGFLQWGYNFYNSAKSLRAINPFLVTDADSAFPSGDAFTVYPYFDGPIESVRAVTFYEGIQDMRAMEYLGNIIGREKLVELIEKDMGVITFEDYPRGAENMLALRQKINELIKENI